MSSGCGLVYGNQIVINCRSSLCLNCRVVVVSVCVMISVEGADERRFIVLKSDKKALQMNSLF